LVHGEVTASETLAGEIRKRFQLEVHVPRWREQLILRPREAAFEKPPMEEPAPDLRAIMLKTIASLENELEALRKGVESGKMDQKIGEEEVDRLKYVREEIQMIVS
jgi:metallo-beta-lactamase family protein